MVFLPFLPKKIFLCSLLILLSLIFNSATSYSQVKIKEKVEINPSRTKPNLRTELSTLSAHEVRIQISMSSNVFCYRYFDWSEQIYKTRCVIGTGTAWITPPGSAGSVTVQGGEATFYQSGTYYWAISWAGPNGEASCHQDAELKVFLDENLIYSFSVTDACSANGPFTVVFPKCEPECSSPSPPQAPTFTVDHSYKNGDYGFNGCSDADHPLGYFYPFIHDKDAVNMFEDFSVDVCYNTSSQKWHASVSGNNIKIRAIFVLCPDNIYTSNIKVLESIDDINTTNIPKESACDALIDFFNHTSKTYKKFLIKEFVEKHEQAHLDQFNDLFLPSALKGIGADGNTFINYSDFINLFGPECLDQNNYDNVKKNAKNFFNEVNTSLRYALLTHYKASYGTDNEMQINESKSLREIIKKYQDKLIELYPDIKNSSCYDHLIW